MVGAVKGSTGVQNVHEWRREIIFLCVHIRIVTDLMNGTISPQVKQHKLMFLLRRDYSNLARLPSYSMSFKDPSHVSFKIFYLQQEHFCLNLRNLKKA